MHARLNHPAVALVLRVIAAALSFAFGIVAARLLGIDTFGVVSVLLGFINVGVVFALLGHETLATREVAALRRGVDPEAAKAYSGSAARQVWIASTIALAALALLVSMLPIGARAGPEFLALLLLVPLVARTRLSQGIIRGAHLASLALVPDGIVRPGLAVVLLGGLVLAGAQTERGFAAVMIGCALVALLLSRQWERNALDHVPESEGGEAPAQARHFSMPIFVSSMLAVLVSQIALISTGLLATPAEAGLYAAAERFSLAAALVGQAVYLAVASRIAALHVAGDKEKLRDLIRKVTRGVSAATLLICGVLALAAVPILGLYGSEFQAAHNLLIVLIVPVMINAGLGPCGVLLLMTKNENAHLIGMIAGLLIQLIGIIVLVPKYGALGAGVSVVFSTIVSNIVMVYFVRRSLGINWLLLYA